MTFLEDGKNWVKDSNGNRCSVEVWGSEAAAQKALDSLSGCSGCRGCSYCRDCSDCSYCSGCRYKKNDISALNPLVIPKIANIHKTIYAAASNPDSLNMSDVHTCQNTHCRGGWTTVLAGPEGKKLEEFLGWEVAAMAIYAASGYEISPNRFHDDNATALADMKRLAEAE